MSWDWAREEWKGRGDDNNNCALTLHSKLPNVLQKRGTSSDPIKTQGSTFYASSSSRSIPSLFKEKSKHRSRMPPFPFHPLCTLRLEIDKRFFLQHGLSSSSFAFLASPRSWNGDFSSRFFLRLRPRFFVCAFFPSLVLKNGNIFCVMLCLAVWLCLATNAFLSLRSSPPNSIAGGIPSLLHHTHSEKSFFLRRTALVDKFLAFQSPKNLTWGRWKMEDDTSNLSYRLFRCRFYRPCRCSSFRLLVFAPAVGEGGRNGKLCKKSAVKQRIRHSMGIYSRTLTLGWKRESNLHRQLHFNLQ